MDYVDYVDYRTNNCYCSTHDREQIDKAAMLYGLPQQIVKKKRAGSPTAKKKRICNREGK